MFKFESMLIHLKRRELMIKSCEIIFLYLSKHKTIKLKELFKVVDKFLYQRTRL